MDEINLLKFVGTRIKHLREEKGITQQELAALCNFEKSNMSRIEAGKSNLTLKTLLNISKSLGIQLIDLFIDLKI